MVYILGIIIIVLSCISSDTNHPYIYMTVLDTMVAVELYLICQEGKGK